MLKCVSWLAILAIVVVGCSTDDGDPSVTNNGSHICYAEQSINGQMIVIVNPDGSGRQELFNDNVPNVNNSDPKWSPDKKKIVFSSNRDQSGNYDIYIANSDGSNPVNLTNDSRVEDFPDISKSGIIFSAFDDAGNTQIFVMDIDGNNEKQLTFFTKLSAKTSSYAARWSEDGKKIVFNSNKDGARMNIYIMNADGSWVTAVTSNQTDAMWGPCLSPDNTKIAFYSKSLSGNNFEIFTVNVDGSDIKQLTNYSNPNLTQTLSGDVSWSPDGKKIAFGSNRDNLNSSEPRYEIYVMNADGSDIQRITNSNVYKIYPDWD